MRKLLSLLAVLVLSASLAFSQSKPITGKLTDAQGQPVPFLTVKVKGSKSGVSADAEGNYSIKAKPGDILVISGTGVTTKEVAVTESLTQDVQLSRISAAMTEVVVTALGIQRQARELGYATSTINNKTLTQAKSINVAQALNGKVSGVNISTTNSGVFENAKINIRGIRSLTGNNQPMLVVDGAPTPLGYLSSLPPDDIQDLTVLKSAASAALYGPDAVNGVIVVTTRKGSKRPVVTLNSSVQAARVSFFPKLQKSFGDGAGEVVDQFGNFGYVPYENQQYGPKFDGSMQPIGVVLEDGSQQMGPYSAAHAKDREKFWNTGLITQNSVSMSGEDFYVSAQDANIKGLTPSDGNRRSSFRFNGSKKYGNFSINYGLNYTLQNSNTVNESGFQNTFPGAYDGGLFFLVLQTAANVPLLSYKDLNSKFGQFSNYYNEYAVNPYWLIANIRSKTREDDILGNLALNYKIFPWLAATAKVSTSLGFANQTNTNAPVVVSDWAQANRNATQYSNKPGSVVEQSGYTSRINLDYFLSGDHKIGSDFKVSYLAGGSIRQDRAKDVTVGGNNLVVPGLYNVAVRSGDANVPIYAGTPSTAIQQDNSINGPQGNNYQVGYRLLSAYGTAALNYKGWANVEFTGRNDWDSRLLKENRSFFYPAGNASVILSDAIPGIQDIASISFLKVFGGISKSGNVNLGPYALQATYSTNAGFPYGSTAGFTANNTFPSPDLKPEFVVSKEIGLELGFLRNTINFSATYFNQNNTNQVLSVTQSGTTGYTALLANAADFKNYGVEADLNLTPLIRIGKGRIDFRINATYNNNEVTRTLNNAPVVIGGNSGFIQNATGYPTVNNIAVVGKPAFQFQMTDYVRDPANGKVIVDPTTGNPSLAGGLITTGRTLPLWVLGFTPSYSIGDFTVSMTWDYKGGANFYSGLGPDEDFSGVSARSAEYGRQRFVFPNSEVLSGGHYVANKNLMVQEGNYGFWTGATTNTGIATNYYASANAWRLRELNFSYSLPMRWIGGGTVIKKVTVSAIGKNLFLFVPKSNQWGDPEFNYSTTNNTFGLASGFQSPPSRYFGGTLTVQF
ncbi:MAG TPA: SusC/RagA family TonB-linked outer membrane protein [Puia sp.]|jgi:TonB-linked SusC/RagA family outer membrane protein